MFCYLTTEFNKIQNRFDMGGVKELIHFECVWSSIADEISFKQISIICEKITHGHSNKKVFS